MNRTLHCLIFFVSLATATFGWETKAEAMNSDRAVVANERESLQSDLGGIDDQVKVSFYPNPLLESVHPKTFLVMPFLLPVSNGLGTGYGTDLVAGGASSPPSK